MASAATAQQPAAAAAAAAAAVPGCLRRRLKALGCPLPVGLESPLFEDCVLWIEETHIRCLSRQRRRDRLATKANWWGGFLLYCKDAGIEAEGQLADSSASRLSLLRKLVALAVRYQYEDATAEGHIRGTDASSLQQQQEQQEQQEQQQQQQQQEYTAQQLQVLHAPLAKILEALHLPPLAPDASPGETLAALKAVEARVCPPGVSSPGGEETLSAQQAEALLQQLPLLLGAPLVGAKGAPACQGEERQFAAALRVLHVAQLQETQEHINDAIERMQLLTADPRTDHRLARVGY